MRTLKRNRQKLYYAELVGSEPVYALDEHVNKIVSYVDDTVIPPVTYYEELGVTEEHYSEPIPIEANIAQSNGDMVEREYGQPITERQLRRIVAAGIRILKKHGL